MGAALNDLAYAVNDTIKDPAKFKALNVLMQEMINNMVLQALNNNFGTENMLPLNVLMENIVGNHGVEEFTADGTFVVPAGVHIIWVTACGGGGGGGGCLYDDDVEYTCYDGNGGNGAAAIKRQPFSVVPGQEIAITIGAAGKAGSNSASSPTAGSAGGSTVIGSLVTLAGGKGGGVNRASQKTTSNNIGGGVGGLGAYAIRTYTSSSGGYSTSSGSSEDGEYGIDNTKGCSKGGGGGGGSLGVGGNGASSSAKATAAGHGGGGGGAASERRSTTTFAATAGGKGYCLIEW